ncbi:hypothetical protein RDABS01_036573 [Bienertia sinuspersici]
MEAYPSGNALFLLEGISNHGPAILRRIKEAWTWNRKGIKMYYLTRKLKQVKNNLMELNRKGFNAIQAKEVKSLQTLTKVQKELQQSPYNADLIQAEKEAQKAKCEWIKVGDANTALFHRSIKQRRLQNHVHAIKNMKGELVDKPEQVAPAFLELSAT